MRFSSLPLALLLAFAGCSSAGHPSSSSSAPEAGADSSAGGFGGFVFDAGLTCVDAGPDTGSAAPCTPSSTSVTFKADVQPILANSCVGEVCHGTNGWGSYSVLTTYHSRECCDHRPIVVPGSPGKSYLMHKLTGHGMCTGVQMPKSLGSLPKADLQTLYDWICLGAKDN